MAGPRFQRKRIGKILAFFKSPAGCRCLPRARWPLFSFVQSDEQKSGSKQSLSAAGNATRRVKREHTWKHSTCLRGMCWGARKRRKKKRGCGLCRTFSPSFSRTFCNGNVPRRGSVITARTLSRQAVFRRYAPLAHRSSPELSRALLKGLSRPQEFRGDSAAVGGHDRSLGAKRRKGGFGESRRTPPICVPSYR